MQVIEAALDTDERGTAQSRFQALLDGHWRIVLKVTNTYARDDEDARDLAQEISFQLWKAFPSFDGVRPFSTWMYRIALNVAISFARSASYRTRHQVPMAPLYEDTLEAPVEPTDHVARKDALRHFMDSLDQLDRALLMLYLEEHSHDEIAEVLGITATNVATKIGRLKTRFRKQIQGD